MKGFGGKGLGRAGSSVIAGGTAAVVVAALGITGSQAAWTDVEYDQATFAALDCAAPGNFNTTAWGRILTAELLGTQIDPIAELEGITVDNLEDGTPTVSEAHGVVAPNDLGDNAWSSNVDASLLSLINASIGVGLLDSPDVGVYTQYGDAESSGQSTGASGVITTSEGGVTLGSSDPDAPGIGTLALSSVLGEIIGEALADDVANLADLALSIGAVASSTSIDACAPIWNGDDIEDYVTRDYLIADLELGFQSALVGALVSDITGLITTLDSATDLHLTALTGLTDLLDGLIGGLPVVGALVDTTGTTIDVSVTTDLSGVVSLLSSEITDTNGVVTIDLSTGQIAVDLAKAVDLNNLPPNTPLLTPAVINTILGSVEDALTDFVNDVLEDAILAALNAASVHALVVADLTIAGVAGVELSIDVNGSYQDLQDGEALIDIEVLADGELLGLVDAALQLVTLGTVSLSTVLTALTDGLVAPLLGGGGLVPALVSAIGTELDGLVAGLLIDLLDETEGLVPALLVALTPVFDLIRSIVDITVNVQPDMAPNPDAPIPPDTPVDGRFFQSALRVSLLDPVSTAPDGLVELYLANSSAGPNTLR